MRNRAKCKKCASIIESFHLTDYVSCNCGEIAISGGDQKFECSANDFDNFLRVDDEGNEIIVAVKGKEDILEPKMGKDELIDMLKEMFERIDALPPDAMAAPATNADLASLMMLIWAILRAE